MALAGVLSAASCAEITTVVDVVFPATVPGLPSEDGWDSLPLRRWLTDSAIEPVAISACFACREPAVVGLFRARGAEASALGRAVRDPAALVAMLSRDRPNAARKASPARVSAEPAQEGGAPGFALRIARPRGARHAGGYVSAVDRDGTLRVVIVVATSEASARAIARGVVPRL